MLKDGVDGVDGLIGSVVPCHRMAYHAYVTGQSDDAVSWCDRNASTGALTYGGMLKDESGYNDGLDAFQQVLPFHPMEIPPHLSPSRGLLTNSELVSSTRARER